MRIVINLTLLCCLLLGVSIDAKLSIAKDHSLTSNGVHLVKSNSDGVIVNVDVTSYSVVESQEGNPEHHAFSVDGAGYTNEIGKPQLPAVSFLVGVPSDSVITLLVSDLSPSTRLDQRYHISPVPDTDLLQDDFSQPKLIYKPDITAYGSNVFYPETLARIAEDGYLRDQRVIRVEAYPFQYNPSSGEVIWHSSLQIEINFINSHRSSEETKVVDDVGSYNNQLTDPFDQVLRSSILNYDQAKYWRRLPEQENIFTTTVNNFRYKIVVDKDGIYRVSGTDFLDAGIDLAQFDPRKFHMTNQGRDVAIYVSGEEDGSFDSVDYVLFYGEKFKGDYLAGMHSDEADNWLTYIQQRADGTSGYWHPEFSPVMLEKYTDDNVYWLYIDDLGIPPRMASVDGTPGGADVPETYTDVVHAELDMRHWEYSFVTEDTWFWDWIKDTSLHSYPISLSAISTDIYTATVRGELIGFNSNILNYPDHHTVITINDQETPVDEAYWDGRSLYSFAKDIPSDMLWEGQNQLNIQILPDSIPYDSLFVNWFEIEYQRLFHAENDLINFLGENEGDWRYQTSGFTNPNVEALIITDPLNPRKVINASAIWAGDGYQVDFQVNHNADETFYLASEQAFLQPKSLTPYAPPNLKSTLNQADYIIIAHPNFLIAAEELRAYRASQGFQSVLINLNDIYNEFNEGIYHPIAIKNFLRYTLANWQPPAPMYVVLIGDGHYNDKFVNPDLYGTLPIYMPVNLGWVDPIQGEVDSSNTLVTLVGDDILPDMVIGRIPVNTPEELSVIITKTMNYEQSVIAEWQRHNLFVADDTPDSVGDFVASAENIILDFVEEGFFSDRIYLDYFEDIPGACGTPIPGGPQCPNANKAITETLSTTGAQLVTYIGHAGIRNWAHELMLVNSDIESLHNQNMLPVILDLGCLDGYWFHPSYQPSLAETFIRAGEDGAVATFSPTGLGVSTGHETLADGFFQSIYKEGFWDLGTATLSARVAVNNLGTFRDLINTYTIFGDPALRLVSPYTIMLSPVQDEKNGLVGSTVVYTLKLTNTSVLKDSFSIASYGNNWTTITSSTLLDLLPGEEQTITVTVDIPLDVPGGTIDTAWIEVISQSDKSKREVTTLITTAQVYGVSLTPPSDVQYGLPGASVNYNLLIENTSTDTDSFLVSVSDNVWLTTTDQLATVLVDPGGTIPLSVTVSIPVYANDYETDTALITVISQTDSSRQANAILETTARTYGVYLSPESQYGTGYKGSQVSYPIIIGNSGGYSDTFTVTLDSESHWIVTPAMIDVGPLLPGESQEFLIVLDIPDNVIIGYIDTISIVAISKSDPKVIDGSVIYTQVSQKPYTYLPVIYK